MRIPQDRNTRAEAMWQIISRRIDFRGKSVIDLGCGTGDFLWRAYVAGAESVDGLDKEDKRATKFSTPLEIGHSPDDNPPDVFFFFEWDINMLVDSDYKGGQYPIPRDIAMCFSVLPYLDDVPATLKWMANSFSTSLIECQYNGDGPGLPNIGGDRGMMQYLINEGGFHQAIPIGKTHVKGRKNLDGNPVSRTIWMCE